LLATVLATCESSALYNKTPDKYLIKIADEGAESVGADLAIVEFDEFGMLWDRRQLDDTLALIKRRNAESKNGVMLLTYTHGWQNNADPNDATGDLAEFRQTLKKLTSELPNQGSLTPNHIVGVYLGWRGTTSNLPGLDTITFWGRKRVAERIASFEMRESLFLIAQAAKSNRDSKVFMSGHSMGGMILAKALAPSLTTALMMSGTEGLPYMADLAVLKNPALDGLSTYQFIKFLKRNGVVAELRSPYGNIETAPGPAIVSITSEADWVTSLAYPAGQIVGNTITATDFRANLGPGMPSQKELSDNTQGHIDYLVSHKAWYEDGKLMLERVPNAYNDTPFWIIQVTKEISSGHSDVNGPKFIELLRRFISLNRLYDSTSKTWLRATTPQQ